MPGAIVTLVACYPSYQGQGYGSRVVQDSLASAAQRGLALAMLYGHPAFYARFGFVPVLPRYETILAISLPFDHLLVRLAVLHGAEQTLRPAAAGMVAVTRWDAVLPPGYRADGHGLQYGERPVLRCGEPALVQLVMGYRSVDDLLLMSDVWLPGGDDDCRLLRREFPPCLPKWSLEPFWF